MTTQPGPNRDRILNAVRSGSGGSTTRRRRWPSLSPMLPRRLWVEIEVGRPLRLTQPPTQIARAAALVILIAGWVLFLLIGALGAVEEWRFHADTHTLSRALAALTTAGGLAALAASITFLSVHAAASRSSEWATPVAGFGTVERQAVLATAVVGGSGARRRVRGRHARLIRALMRSDRRAQAQRAARGAGRRQATSHRPAANEEARAAQARNEATRSEWVHQIASRAATDGKAGRTGRA